MAEEIKLEFNKTMPVFDMDTNEPLAETAQPEKPAEGEGYMESVNLTEEEKQMVSDFAEQIDQ